MATLTYLTNPSLTIQIGAGSPVDFTDQCTAFELVSSKESQDVTAFGDAGRKFAAGLQNNTITMTLFLSYGSGEVESLQAAVGATCTIVAAPTTATASAANPSYTLTGCYLESFTPINGSVGEMSTVDLTFTGGLLTRNVGS
jgi:hypothetical protein